MAEAPGHLTLKRHRDLVGRQSEAWIRRALLGALLVFPVAGLLNAFGQVPSSERVTGAPASLEVSSPTRLRGGLIYQARFEIRANRTLAQPKLVLDRGWLESMTLNTKEPDPVSEATQDGRIVLSYDRLEQARSLVVFLEFQVNPTNVGRHDQDVQLYDGSTPLLSIDRSVTVFP